MHPNLQQVVQPGLVAEVEHQGPADQLSSLLVPREELVGLLLWYRKRLRYKNLIMRFVEFLVFQGF